MNTTTTSDRRQDVRHGSIARLRQWGYRAFVASTVLATTVVATAGTSWAWFGWDSGW